MDIELPRATTTSATVPPSFLARNRWWLWWIIMGAIVMFVGIFTWANLYLAHYKPNIDLDSIQTKESNHTILEASFSIYNSASKVLKYDMILAQFDYKGNIESAQSLEKFNQRWLSRIMLKVEFTGLHFKGNITSSSTTVILNLHFHIAGFLRSDFYHKVNVACNVDVVGGGEWSDWGGSFAGTSDHCTYF